MSITIYNIKKWTKMLLGKSILHVNQDEGKIYSVTDIEGYYNNLTEKVTRSDISVTVPTRRTERADEVYFPIEIFQFGLGAYDLYLIEEKQIYLEKFKSCVNWAVSNQAENGSWNNFYFTYPQAPYSAMAQGEGVSLLLRAYKEFGKEEYLRGAKKALEFMLVPIENGGTTLYRGKEIYLMEYTHKAPVLNGWIFALFGIMDYLKVDRDNTELISIYNQTVETMLNNLDKFDCGYWSLYDMDRLTCSPFYHDLHIAQLTALYKLTGIEKFIVYADKWNEYRENKYYKSKAFIKKAIEKIRERE